MESFNKWVIKNFGGDSIEEAIYNKVSELLKQTNQEQLPVDLEIIAKHIGIDPTPLWIDNRIGDIYIHPNSEGELIKINYKFRIAFPKSKKKQYGSPRFRFAYAHELIHCLFYDFSYSPPKRIAPKPLRREEEIVCNKGASFLLLPQNAINDIISSLEFDDIIYKVNIVSKKAQTSIHTTILYFINNNLLKNVKNKLYILSKLSKGLGNRKKEKPRCITSIFFNEKGEKNTFFLPAYQGLDKISKTWSLMRFFNNNFYPSKLYVQNEIINYKNKKFILNGFHIKLEKSNYVWSELDIKELKE